VRRQLLIVAGYAVTMTAIVAVTGLVSLLALVAIFVVGVALGAWPPSRSDPLLVVVEVCDEDKMVTQFVVPVLIPAGCDEAQKCTAARLVQEALPLPEYASLATRWRDV
jgi:hypothetical protein